MSIDTRHHPHRTGAACLAHVRRKFHERAKGGTRAVAEEAPQPIAKVYVVEVALRGRTDEQRRQGRRAMSAPRWAMGRKAWLFCGSELAGQRAAMVMSLLLSARLHGHEPWGHPEDVLVRLPLHPASRINARLLHRWMPAAG